MTYDAVLFHPLQRNRNGQNKKKGHTWRVHTEDVQMTQILPK